MEITFLGVVFAVIIVLLAIGRPLYQAIAGGMVVVNSPGPYAFVIIGHIKSMPSSAATGLHRQCAVCLPIP